MQRFHKPEDRARVEANARGQCKQPFTIGQGANGGVMMYLAGSTQLQELRLMHHCALLSSKVVGQMSAPTNTPAAVDLARHQTVAGLRLIVAAYGNRGIRRVEQEPGWRKF